MRYIRTFESYLNENKIDYTIQDYLNQVEKSTYINITNELYELISDEGWLEQIEEYFNIVCNQEDFEYIKLSLSEEDRIGLITRNDETIEKFNKFDILLKANGEYPYDTLDFIDYEKGIVYIIRMQ